MTTTGRAEYLNQTIEKSGKAYAKWNASETRRWLNYIEGCPYSTWNTNDLEILDYLRVCAPLADHRTRARHCIENWTEWDRETCPWQIWVHTALFLVVGLLIGSDILSHFSS